MIRTLSFILALFTCTSCLADSQRPFERESDKYLSMLFSKQYEELERLAKDYRINNRTISDGQPSLAALHGGITGCLSNGCRDNLTEEDWARRLEHIEEWVRRYPNSITARVAGASYYMEYAWHARGRGYANTVSEDGWRIFRENIDIAFNKLKEIEEEGKKDPRWYDSMLMIGLAKKWPRDTFERVYQDGIKAHPLYLPLYFDKSAYLAPRWYGSEEKLREYVEEAVNDTKAQMGETLYARLNWSLRTNHMFKNGQADWSRMKAGFERMIQDYPDPWNINNYAKFACLAEDWETVSSLGEKIGQNPLLDAWSQSQRYYHQCIAFSKVMSSAK